MSHDLDVVFLSKARTPELYAMTQHAVDTCVDGAEDYDLNVIVLEQVANLRYRSARTIHRPGTFNFNAFANYGVSLGNAKWVMVATNDLSFEQDWLEPLLAVGRPVVSPIDPGSSTQADITEDTCGWVKSRHFSGWCFLIRRDVWEDMGGFDERVSFWCSDDAVLEQLKALGVMEPMLVVASRVHHRVSATLKDEPNMDDLTWRQVYIFNQLYGQRLGEDNERYLDWKRRAEVT